jgi:hypothetical protein
LMRVLWWTLRQCAEPVCGCGALAMVSSVDRSD